MKYNLSSVINIEMIPERYYKATDAIEILRQKRFEKLETKIVKDQKEGALSVAKRMATLINRKKKTGDLFVLGLSGGTSCLPVYEELIKMYEKGELDLAHVVAFNVSEFFPIYDDKRHSNGKFLRDIFISKVNILADNFITPDSSVDRSNVYDYCHKYEQLVEQYGGLDFVLLSVGLVGNIAYNEPGSQPSSLTRLMLLDHESRRDLKRFYSSPAEVPNSAITIGLSNIQNAKEVILLAWGENKSQIIKEVLQGKVDDNVPASFLQQHKNAMAVVDLAAAEHLTRISQPWLVGSCEWTNKLIRRAIVWLCMETGKPILKLTNKDYNKHGLDELLSLYGSAYDVNIRIFNDLQRTITGWPGGKPNADDANRPERAYPYPKRVLVFSPHPDDDVISMGGTLQRLVDQNHDVHVAYETSGNIAVGDEEIIRSISLFRQLNNAWGDQPKSVDDKCEQILHFLTNAKQSGDIDSQDVLFMKGRLRQEEARSACRYIGIKPQNVHFLALPFYETGKIQKDKLSENDIVRVISLLQEVQPHQIYLAGDLADPHGTHKVCLDAALSAIHEIQDEAWFKDCRVWMYRGAWAEWEIDHIEMAVPISPEELRKKRNSILHHQSQMESAPFLGNDERLFWQRSEDRNKATADMYRNLGLASYEAIEAFVELKWKDLNLD